MPSPFPGIDPYLEARGRWSDFQPRFLTHLCEAISEHLPDSYIAQMEERVRLGRPGGDPWPNLRPAVGILRREGPARGVRLGPALALMEPVAMREERRLLAPSPPSPHRGGQLGASREHGHSGRLRRIPCATRTIRTARGTQGR